MKLKLLFGTEGLDFEWYIVFGIGIRICEFNIGVVLVKRRR